MQYIFILSVILLLYSRTYFYKNVIDDICDRKSYLEVFTQNIDKPGFYDKRRSWWVTVQCVSMFTITCMLICKMFGFHVALLYAIYPLNVAQVAWKTGSFLYGNSMTLMLISLFFFNGGTLPGYVLSNIFYFTSLHLSLAAIPFAPVVLVLTQKIEAITLFIPLAMFLFGKRFRRGLQLRVELHKDTKTQGVGVWNLERLAVIPKALGYQIQRHIHCFKLGFFHESTWFLHNGFKDKFFYAYIVLILVFMGFGFLINFEVTICYFLAIGVFSQVKAYGMFYAERYQVLSNLFYLILISTLLQDYPQCYWLLVGLYSYKTFQYVKAWRSDEALFRESLLAFPDSVENAVNLGGWYLRHGEFPQAVTAFHYGYRTIPGKVHNNILRGLAQSCMGCGRWAEAIKYIDAALPGCPKSEEALLQTARDQCHNRLLVERRRK